MKNFFQSYQIALSFFTIIPIIKHYEWTKARIRFIPIMLPIIGALIGSIIYGSHWLLNRTPLSSLTISFIMVILLLIVTGGLHHDGLMDVSDAFFSRSTTIERRLEIMKDSYVGAFGVITLVVYMGLLWMTFYEIREGIKPLLFIFIPILSRLMIGMMFYYYPYARKNGIAILFGVAIVKKDRWMMLAFIMVISLLMYDLLNIKGLILMGVSLISVFLYRFYVIKHFGGMTGDLQGAFLLILELLLYMVAGFIHYI